MLSHPPISYQGVTNVEVSKQNGPRFSTTDGITDCKRSAGIQNQYYAQSTVEYWGLCDGDNR